MRSIVNSEDAVREKIVKIPLFTLSVLDINFRSVLDQASTSSATGYHHIITFQIFSITNLPTHQLTNFFQATKYPIFTSLA